MGGRHADSPGHNSTFGTRVWTTARIAKMASVCVVPETWWVTISHRGVRIGPFSNRTNEGIMRVDDLGFSCAHHNHQFLHTSVCHLASVCGRHVGSPFATQHSVHLRGRHADSVRQHVSFGTRA